MCDIEQTSKDGPGPKLVGADTLIGNDVYNKDGESLSGDPFTGAWPRRWNRCFLIALFAHVRLIQRLTP